MGIRQPKMLQLTAHLFSYRSQNVKGGIVTSVGRFIVVADYAWAQMFLCLKTEISDNSHYKLLNLSVVTLPRMCAHVVSLVWQYSGEVEMLF